MNTDLVRKIEEKAKARRNPQSSAVDATWLSDTRESARTTGLTVGAVSRSQCFVW